MKNEQQCNLCGDNMDIIGATLIKYVPEESGGLEEIVNILCKDCAGYLEYTLLTSLEGEEE